MISSLIVAAREYCEAFQNRAYITQTLELTLDHFPHHYPQRAGMLWGFPFGAYELGYHRHHHRRHDQITLPRPPIQSVEYVAYTDSSGTTITVDPSTYIVDTDSEPGRIVPASGQVWPIAHLQPINGVKVRYTAGYGSDAGSVPNAVKQAMMMLIAHWYENREAVVIMGSRSIGTELDLAVKSLLSTDRVVPT